MILFSQLYLHNSTSCQHPVNLPRRPLGITLSHVLLEERTTFVYLTSEASIFFHSPRVREFNLIYICQRPGSVIPLHPEIYGTTQPGQFILSRLEPWGRSSRTGNGVNFHGPGKFINPLCILQSGRNPVASRRNPPSTWSCFLARLPLVTHSSATSLRRAARRCCHFSHEFRRHTWT